MAFSSIMTFICVGYVLAYGGMVIYDLFFAKEPVKLAPKVEEEEIDISDEAKSFNPVFIDGEGRFHWEQEKDQNDDAQEQQSENVERQPEERAEQMESKVESEGEDVTKSVQQSGEGSVSPAETVSASELEASAREQAQAWMDAQIGGVIDTENNSETEKPMEDVSDDTSQAQTKPELALEMPESEFTSETDTNCEAVEESSAQQVESTGTNTDVQTSSHDEEPSIMTGAIEVAELTAMLDLLAEKGENSPLGRIVRIWNVEAA